MGYVVRTWYVDDLGNWLVSADSSPSFEISTGTLPTPTVTAPSSAGPFSQGNQMSVAWDVASPSSEGSFNVYAYNGTYYFITSQEADGSSSYDFDWTIDAPVGSDYVVRVWYVDTEGAWLISDDSSPAFSIQ